MKNIFQGLRDLPDYPLVAVRLIAFWFLLFGVGNLVVGATFIIPDRYAIWEKYPEDTLKTLRTLIPAATQLSVLHGIKELGFEIIMERYSPDIILPDPTRPPPTEIYHKGYNPGAPYIVFWGALYLLTALLLTLRFRRTTLAILSVWIIYSCVILTNFIRPTSGVPLYSNLFAVNTIDASFNQWLLNAFRPPLLSVFIMIVIPLCIGSVLILDERVKAYFGKGIFAEAYRAYFKDQKAIRKSKEKKVLPNPWVMEQKS